MTAGWTVFDTALGACGFSWDECGVTALALPDADGGGLAELRQRTACEEPAARLPEWVRLLARQIQRHLTGNAQDFSAVPVSIADTTPFAQSVYRAAQAIPAGERMTYAQLAQRLGNPGAVRAVGSALGRNRIPLIIPCHRVVAAGNRPGGFSAPGGLQTKQALLACEGIHLFPPTVLSPALWQQAVASLKREPLFARLARQVGPVSFRPRRSESPLAALVDAIVSQQLATRVAAIILQRVHALIDRRGEPDAARMLALPEQALREAGLSAMKVSYLRDLARHVQDGLLPDRAQMQWMTDEAIIRRLIAIKGVGRWTAEMFLMFDLGRADVFPVDDYGVRKAIMQLHGLPQMPAANAMLAYGERWRPYRTVVSLYLWRSLDNFQ